MLTMGMFDNDYGRNCNNEDCECLYASCDKYNADKYFAMMEEEEEYDEAITAEEMLQAYIREVLLCESAGEVEELLTYFFEDVSAFTMEELFKADIQGRLEVLKMLKEKRR